MEAVGSAPCSSSIDAVRYYMWQLLLLLPAVMADPFWMTADLMRVDWSEGCLTTAGCSHPRFEILGDLLPLTEEISISWPISEHFVQETSRSFVSHWTKGKPEDLKLRCQVVGTDPLYGFPRVCDHTAWIRAFPDDIEEILKRRRSQTTITTTALPEEELGKRLIEIRARCFNATVAVEKHTERCPWCPDPSDVALIEQRLLEDPSSVSTSIFSRLKSDDRILQASLLTLAGITILMSMSFACALVALLRQKSNSSKSQRQITVKTRCQTYSPPSCKTSEDENRYDMPWEQTLPLTYCLSSSSKSTATSPLDSTSSFGASLEKSEHEKSRGSDTTITCCHQAKSTGLRFRSTVRCGHSPNSDATSCDLERNGGSAAKPLQMPGSEKSALPTSMVPAESSELG